MFVVHVKSNKIQSVQGSSFATIIIDGIYFKLQSAKLSVLIEVTDLILITFA